MSKTDWFYKGIKTEGTQKCAHFSMSIKISLIGAASQINSTTQNFPVRRVHRVSFEVFSEVATQTEDLQSVKYLMAEQLSDYFFGSTSTELKKISRKLQEEISAVHETEAFGMLYNLMSELK